MHNVFLISCIVYSFCTFIECSARPWLVAVHTQKYIRVLITMIMITITLITNFSQMNKDACGDKKE